jgi:MYXO-CTERM domain-containing protein
MGTNCIPLIVYSKGFSQMPADEVTTAATAAASQWTREQNACSYLTLTMSGSTDDPPVSVPVPQASIVFRESIWCFVESDGSCSKMDQKNVPYDEHTLMLTSDAVNKVTGQVLMGATEVNAVNFRWADLGTHHDLLAGDPNLQDLQNALTHELGHFVGLGHTCTLGAASAPALDDQGNPVPNCATASAEIQATTMAASALPGDLNKRTIEADDQRGLCAIYPAAQDPSPGMCVTPAEVSAMTGGGCSCATAAGEGPPAAAAVAPLALAAAVAGRRRRRG